MPAVPNSGFTRVLYNTIFKKNSVFATTVFAAAIGFQAYYDTAATKIWDHLNKGVS